MKIAIVYTGITDELVEMVEQELSRYFKDQAVTFMDYHAPEVIADVKKRGFVSFDMKKRMLSVYQQAAKDGARIILNICSSIREAAEEAREQMARQGVRLILFDEKMIQEAVRQYTQIGIVATLETALDSTKRCVRQYSEKLDKHVVITDFLIKDSFGSGEDVLKEKCMKVIHGAAEMPEVLILAQGSMACVQQELEKALCCPVLSGLKPGIEEVWEAYRNHED